MLSGLKNDIRPLCESAMALIENKVRSVYLIKVRLVSSSKLVNSYLFSNFIASQKFTGNRFTTAILIIYSLQEPIQN